MKESLIFPFLHCLPPPPGTHIPLVPKSCRENALDNLSGTLKIKLTVKKMFTNSHTDSHEQKQLKVRLQQMRAIDKFWKREEQIQVIIDKTELRKLEGRTS